MSLYEKEPNDTTTRKSEPSREGREKIHEPKDAHSRKESNDRGLHHVNQDGRQREAYDEKRSSNNGR